MIDVMERAKAALEASGFSGVKLRLLTSNEEGVCIRPVPSTVIATYMDGEQDIAYLFNVFVRRQSEEQAIEDCEAAATAIVLGDMRSNNGSYELSGCSIYTPTQEMDNSDGSHTYKVGMRADITTKGE